MNSALTLKLLQNLRNKKQNKGFTLIELLVVVIIIGVLAAVALPNLLSQVGKARESEGKTGVGTINRSQQTYHFENQVFPAAIDNAGFANIDNELGISVQSDYFEFDTNAPTLDPTDNNSRGQTNSVTQVANAINATGDGVREFSGGTKFDAGSGNYDVILCQSNGVDDTLIDTGTGIPDLSGPQAACTGSTKEIK